MQVISEQFKAMLVKNSIAFTVPAIPIAQPRQRHRAFIANGHLRTQNYTPAKSPVNAFKASVQHAAAIAYQGEPLEGPLALVLLFVMPRPAAMLWKKRPTPRVSHIKKPDLDNLAKSVKDSLKGLVWRDDSQVCLMQASKFIAAGTEQPHVAITIQRILT